jgi:hypothetical protein
MTVRLSPSSPDLVARLRTDLAAAPHLIADEDTLLCLISGELRLR